MLLNRIYCLRAMTEHKFMGNIEMNTRETVLEISGEGIFWHIENTLKTSARLLGKKIFLLWFPCF